MITLILKEDELLYIGDNIVISCYRHQDRRLQRCGVPSSTQQVKLAIEAPREVNIRRLELDQPS